MEFKKLYKRYLFKIYVYYLIVDTVETTKQNAITLNNLSQLKPNKEINLVNIIENKEDKGAVFYYYALILHF